MEIKDPAIPLGSLVVVIGANGHIASETCEKLLSAGYRVRATVRDVGRHKSWMHKLFDPIGDGMFELVEVQDFEKEGTFDLAFQGATAVIYASPPVKFSADPTQSITPIIKSTINCLQAASHAKVDRFVLVSSSQAVENAVYNQPHHLTTKTFNHKAIVKALCEPRDDSPARALTVYSAGRTLAELTFWNWIEENRPPFVANSVIPEANFGRTINAGYGNTGATSINGFLMKALNGEWEGIVPYLAHVVDVQDTARLLVTAVTVKSAKSERIFAYNQQQTWTQLREKVHKIRPDIVKGPEQDIDGRDIADASEAIQRASELLREVGRPGFTSVEDMLKDFVEACY